MTFGCSGSSINWQDVFFCDEVGEQSCTTLYFKKMGLDVTYYMSESMIVPLARMILQHALLICCTYYSGLDHHSKNLVSKHCCCLTL